MIEDPIMTKKITIAKHVQPRVIVTPFLIRHCIMQIYYY